MTDITLRLTAFLLALFCMLYSVTVRRKLIFQTHDSAAKPKYRRVAFLTVLSALTVASIVSIIETVVGTAFDAPAVIIDVIHVIGIVFRILLLCLFVLYVGILSKRSKSDRITAIIFFAVAVLGALIQALWSAPVELFFAAVSVLGFMFVFEYDEDDPEKTMNERVRRGAVIGVVLTFLAVIVMNTFALLDLTHTQADEIGRIKLDIRGKKEGIVIRPTEPVFCPLISASLSMKIVSNRYLLKNEE